MSRYIDTGRTDKYGKAIVHGAVLRSDTIYPFNYKGHDNYYALVGWDDTTLAFMAEIIRAPDSKATGSVEGNYGYLADLLEQAELQELGEFEVLEVREID